jgi:micrococcal nuclease
MEIIMNFVLAFITFWFGGGDMQPESVVNMQASTSAAVIRVVDGDTIKVQVDGREETVRYIGIDTPEPYRDGEPACYSQEATARNTELVAGTQVQLVSDTENRDKYDRLLRYVYVDEVFINELLIQEGYATTLQIKPNTAQASTLQSAEDLARDQNVGLWSACRGGSVPVTPAAVPATSPQVIEIDTTTLPSGQQQILNTFGLDESNVTITPEVVACAQTAIGTDRVAAITDGDTPSIIEGIKLANCYRVY